MPEQYEPPAGDPGSSSGQPYQGPPPTAPYQPYYAPPPSGPQPWSEPQQQPWSGPQQPWVDTANTWAETQQPWASAPAPPPIPPGTRPNRRGVMIGAGIVALVVVIAAVVNLSRREKSNGSGDTPFVIPTYTSLSPFPFPSGSLPNDGGLFGRDPDGTLIPAVFCPIVRDDKSHLSYRCIDDSLVQDGSDNFLGLRISLNRLVETDWVVSEGSGNPETIVKDSSQPTTVAFPRVPMAPPSSSPTGAPGASDIRSVVEDRARRSLERAYGDNPTSKVLSQGPREVDGVTGYELNLEITMNPLYRAHRNPPLKTKTERLWIVGVPTKAGVSIFMLSIPDLRKDLWPKAEDTIDTINII